MTDELVATGFTETALTDSTPALQVSTVTVDVATEETSPTLSISDIVVEALLNAPTAPEFRAGTFALFYTTSATFISEDDFQPSESFETPFDRM